MHATRPSLVKRYMVQILVACRVYNLLSLNHLIPIFLKDNKFCTSADLNFIEITCINWDNKKIKTFGIKIYEVRNILNNHM